jgi:hypothetical protein
MLERHHGEARRYRVGVLTRPEVAVVAVPLQICAADHAQPGASGHGLRIHERPQPSNYRMVEVALAIGGGGGAVSAARWLEPPVGAFVRRSPTTGNASACGKEP